MYDCICSHHIEAHTDEDTEGALLACCLCDCPGYIEASELYEEAQTITDESTARCQCIKWGESMCMCDERARLARDRLSALMPGIIAEQARRIASGYYANEQPLEIEVRYDAGKNN